MELHRSGTTAVAEVLLYVLYGFTVNSRQQHAGYQVEHYSSISLLLSSTCSTAADAVIEYITCCPGIRVRTIVCSGIVLVHPWQVVAQACAGVG